MNTLWEQAKDAICGNTQYVDIDEPADTFIAHVNNLSNREELPISGVNVKAFLVEMSAETIILRTCLAQEAVD